MTDEITYTHASGDYLSFSCRPSLEWDLSGRSVVAKEGKTGITNDKNSCLRNVTINTYISNSSLNTLHGYLAPSTAPSYDGTTEVDACVVFEDPVTYTTETTDCNDAGANDVDILPTIPSLNDAFYIGMSFPLSMIKLNIGTAGSGVWTITWEYSQGGSSWAALSGVVDDSGGFMALGNNFISWTIPPDWATDTVNSITDLYWVRGRVSAYTSVIQKPILTQGWLVGEYPNLTYIIDGNVTWQFPCVITERPKISPSGTARQTITLKFLERTI